MNRKKWAARMILRGRGRYRGHFVWRMRKIPGFDPGHIHGRVFIGKVAGTKVRTYTPIDEI
jgi:hypothetical protein